MLSWSSELPSYTSILAQRVCWMNTAAVQRGRRPLAVRDIPAVWLVMWAKPGKLLASLASPPFVSSWWIALVLATGTARSRVLLLVVVVVVVETALRT